jgi:hypothetical protein
VAEWGVRQLDRQCVRASHRGASHAQVAAQGVPGLVGWTSGSR